MDDKDLELFVLKIGTARISSLRNLLDYKDALQPDAQEMLLAELKERQRERKRDDEPER